MDHDLTRDALTTIAILADENEMPGVEEARAMGRAIYLNLGTNIEEHFFEGMVDAARARGLLDDLITAFVKATGAPPSAEKSPRNEDRRSEGRTSGEHRIPGSSTVWRSATRKTYGGAPVRLGDKALARGPDQDDCPGLVVCVDIDTDADEPIWRGLTMLVSRDPVYDPGDLRYVETLDDLRPGTWTRLPW